VIHVVAGKNSVLTEDVRSSLAALAGYALFLDSEYPKARVEAPHRFVESVQALSKALERALEGLSVEPEEGRDESPPGPSLLVVDDDSISRGLLTRMLPADLEVLEAEDSESALLLAGLENVELLVVTWRASGFSGPELLAELEIRYPQIPILVVAEANDEPYEDVARLLGAEKFLVRPLNSVQLLNAITEMRAGDRVGDIDGDEIEKTADSYDLGGSPVFVQD
jgi:CheY-like chemotaxis protein